MDFDKSKHAAEIQLMQQMLNQQFSKNIRFFKKNSPAISDKFEKHSPTDIILKLSEQGYLNIYNKKLNNKPVYSYDPQEFCQDYIDQYIKKPLYYHTDSHKSTALDHENIIHISLMNRCQDLMEPFDARSKYVGIEKTCNFLLLNGIGMGYILPQIMDHTDIKNLVIIEPHDDIFYSSLFILDWEQVYKHFSKPYHSLKLIIGQNTSDSVNTMRVHLNRIGLHNAVNPYKIDHLSSKEMKDITDTFFDRLGIMFSSAGYFDDEQVGLAHTIENWTANTPPLREHSLLNKKFLDLPAFIIGNGPSLDDAQEFLKKHKDGAVIFSCGTTIGSLNKIGIKPDFHVEMERTKPVIEWLKNSTDEEYRSNIILLALNTVHPEVFNLFKNKGMGLKSNDLGTHFFSKYIPNDLSCINLAFCNPTVGNAGLAFALALGFREVYLFGLDLGFSSGEQHHSKHSTHYRVDEKHSKKLNLYTTDDKGNKEAPANFGGTVLTTPVYRSAAIAMEGCIKQAGNVKCYNTSNGILIGETTPLKIDEIKIRTKTNKTPIIENLFNEYFYSDNLIQIENSNEIKSYFSATVEHIKKLQTLFDAEQSNWDTAQNLLSEQHQSILKLGFNQNTQYIYTLLKGSVYAFNLSLNKALYLGKTRDEGLELFNQLRVVYLEFLQKAAIKINQDLLSVDQKTRDLHNKLTS